MSNLLKTNSKQYNNNFSKFLLESIQTWEEEQTFKNVKEACAYVIEQFNSHDCEYNKRRILNDQARLADWIAGLPSIINIPFSNFDILEEAKKLHEVDSLTEKQNDMIINNWFNHVALMVMRFANK